MKDNIEFKEYNNGVKNDLIDQKIYKLLPTTLRKLTDNFEGREKDIILTSSIGVLSACLPNVYGMYGSEKLYSNLYLMIIAPAASGKGVMNKSRLLIITVR